MNYNVGFDLFGERDMKAEVVDDLNADNFSDLEGDDVNADVISDGNADDNVAFDVDNEVDPVAVVLVKSSKSKRM